MHCIVRHFMSEQNALISLINHSECSSTAFRFYFAGFSCILRTLILTLMFNLFHSDSAQKREEIEKGKAAAAAAAGTAAKRARGPPSPVFTCACTV